MELTKALTLSLGNINLPVFTQYQLGKLLFQLYKAKQFRGEPLSKVQKDYPDSRDFYRICSRLLHDGVLSEYRGLPSSVYTLLGRENHPVEEVVCTIDPFCYLSHLSAMDYHGLTDRLPSKTFISSPPPKSWRVSAQEKMETDLKHDLPTYIECGLPQLRRVNFKRVGKHEISVLHSSHLGAYKNVRGRNLRVATIGRTFLDMLRTPELCGGMNHVIEVFSQFAQTYLRLITDEIDTNGRAIDKVRAGYIIDELLEIKNETVASWAQFAQRGGSRKLDHSEEYIPQWSDKWCLSINIFKRT
ncbi:MAG: type IV toxin-antitoxin system AbiEi family antitoxin domain-containing protein [Pseudomonadota bacterium]